MNAILAPNVLSGAAARIVLMPRVAIVTDSSACLPPQLVERYHVIVVPLAFLFDGELSHELHKPALGVMVLAVTPKVVR